MSVFLSDWVDMFWKKGHCLPPKKLGSENELCTAWTSMPSHLHHALWEPQTCQTALFFQARRVGRWQHKQEEWKLRPLAVISLHFFELLAFALVLLLFQQLTLAATVGSFLKWIHSCSSGCNTLQGFWAAAMNKKKKKKRRPPQERTGTIVRRNESSLWR